eukprot:PLAT201.7.p2 GENE.PLAT201.7~~PLAT201.7.p2  ORF type:complete len:346 (+),score=196.69 PLAT201.7:73-1110(+)
MLRCPSAAAGVSAARMGTAAMSSLASLLQAGPARFAAKDALRSVSQGYRWSASALASHATAFSSGLQQMGLSAGDTLAVWRGSDAEHVVALLGAAHAGVTVAELPAATMTTDAALSKALAHSGASALLFDAEVAADGDALAIVESVCGEAALAAASRGRPLVVPALPSLRRLLHSSFDSPGPAMQRMRDVLCYDSAGSTAAVSDDTAALVTYDGSGKQTATYSRAQLAAAADAALAAMELNASDRLLLAADVSSPIALAGALLPAAAASALVVLPGAAADAAAAAADAAALESVTAVAGDASSVAAAASAAGDASALSHLRTGVFVGAEGSTSAVGGATLHALPL